MNFAIQQIYRLGHIVTLFIVIISFDINYSTFNYDLMIQENYTVSISINIFHTLYKALCNNFPCTGELIHRHLTNVVLFLCFWLRMDENYRVKVCKKKIYDPFSSLFLL